MTNKSSSRLDTAKYLIIFLTLSICTGSGVLAQERGVYAKVQNEQGIVAEKKLYDESYALVIGAIDYQKPGWIKLDGVKNDVKEISRTLTAQGFEVRQLLNPTSQNLNSTIREFVTKYGIKPNNRLIIYFSGHGYTETDEDGIRRGYIVPVDAPSPEKYPDEFFGKATTMDDIEGFARNIRSKHALFIFDSCFSGTLISRESLSASKYISYITEKPVRQFITAGAANQVVPDESIFRRMFVKALDPNDEDNADKNKDGYVTGTELAVYLQEKVIYYQGQKQTPQYGKLRDPRFDQGDFVFALGKKTTAAVPVTTNSDFTIRAANLADQSLNEVMRGNFREAQNLANEALNLDDNSALANAVSGWSQCNLKSDYKGALINAKKAVRLDPNNVLFRVRLAVVYDSLNNADLSVQLLKQDQNQLPAPKAAIEYYARGLINNFLNFQDDAIADYSEAIGMDGQFVLAYNNRGYALYMKKDYDAAIDDYNIAISLNPGFADAYHNRGVAYFEKQEFDTAIRDCSMAIRLNPNYANAYLVRGNAYEKIGKNSEAKIDRRKYKDLGGK